MSIRRSKISALGVAALALPLVVGMGAPALAATPPPGAYAESYGLLVDDTLLEGAVPVNIGPEAPASSSCPGGGTKSAQVLSVGDPAVAKVDVINDTATTDCAAPSSKAVSNIVNADALGAVEQLKVHADAVTATSTTSCTKAPAGSTDIVNLSIGGNLIPIPSNPIPPNTAIDLSPLVGINIILNEQHPASTGRGLVVNGIHIIANASGALPIGGSVIRGDIIIAHAVSGVVCPGGPGTDNGGLPKPDISFVKSASPTVAHPGDTVTYTAQITNQSTTPCEVLKMVDHIAPAFTLVSSSGPLGTKLDSPPPTRTDGGVDAVLRPTNVTIAPGKTVTQTFTVKVKADAAPGTYYDMLEIFCGPNGNFVSGPLAPVTVPAENPPPVSPEGPGQAPPPQQPFGPTGLNTTVAGAALLLLLAAAGTRRFQLSRQL
ncbi:MAG TPA: choice-of-anchor P family protein [Mycobacteriales bacterium]|nr:choice-of-anchor P family protein [Mycobacteriales bacterium]